MTPFFDGTAVQENPPKVILNNTANSTQNFKVYVAEFPG